jgi:hypothetical protein
MAKRLKKTVSAQPKADRGHSARKKKPANFPIFPFDNRGLAPYENRLL